MQFSDKNLDLDRIKNLQKMRKYKKSKNSDINYPLINSRILSSIKPQNEIKSLNNSNSSTTTNQNLNDIDELMINDCTLLIKKFVLPKINAEPQNSSFILKKQVKIDINNKILLQDLLNDDVLDNEYKPNLIQKNEEIIKSLSKKNDFNRKNILRIKDIKALQAINDKIVVKKVSKEEWFSKEQDRVRLKNVLTNDFSKLEGISHLINRTLDSALEMLYSNAIALDKDY